MERPSSECGARSPQSLDDPVDCFDEFFVKVICTVFMLLLSHSEPNSYGNPHSKSE